LQALYELEYKWSMMRSRPFSGMERRQDNIIKGLERNLNEVLEEVKAPLERLYISWLRSHAITDPAQWGEARTRDGLEGYDEHDTDPYVNEMSLQ